MRKFLTSRIGCKVAIASRDFKKLEATAKILSKVGDVKAFQCNIRSEDDVGQALSNIKHYYGNVDMLVNNGGGQFPSLASNMSIKGWKAVIDTNLNGTFLMSTAMYKEFFSKNGGSIVNIIADMFRGFPVMSHTGAARAGVENITRSLAIEWAQDGVRVNCVAPGIVYSSSARSNYEFDVFEAARPGIPAKRTANTEEISSAVVFLLSEGAAYITGATLRVDAGSSLYSPLMWNIPEHNSFPSLKWMPVFDDKDSIQ